MINRLVPAGMEPSFLAKVKTVPGEISRVKKTEEVSQNKLVRSPKADTFTASNKSQVHQEQTDTNLKNDKDNISERNNEKGNA